MLNTRVLIFIFLMCSSVWVFAGTWTTSGKITRLQVTSTKDIIINHEDMTVNPNECTYTSYYRMASTAANFKEVYALLLMARATKEDVLIYIDGCLIDRPQFTDVKIDDSL